MLLTLEPFHVHTQYIIGTVELEPNNRKNSIEDTFMT